MARQSLGVIVRTWLPVAIWVGVIALESSDLMSAQHTGSLLYTVAQAIFGPIDQARFEAFHHVLRKSGHFLGYGTLALLSFRAFRCTVATALSRLWMGALLLTAVVASADEWHQSFIPSRTGSLYDVLLDTCGGIVLLLMATLWMRRKRSTQVV